MEERRQLTRLINEDAFFPLKSWPKETWLICWKKPMAYTETFKLVLFLIGNGCEPSLIRRWTMLVRHWPESTTRQKRGQDKSILSSTMPTMPEQPSAVLL